jgi:hypothetical protein
MLQNPVLTGGLGAAGAAGAGGLGIATLLKMLQGEGQQEPLQIASPNMGEIPPELLALLGGTRGKIY